MLHALGCGGFLSYRVYKNIGLIHQKGWAEFFG